MSGVEGSGAALQQRLDQLRLLILDRLIDILENGAPVQKPDPKTGRMTEIGRAPAPPAYLSAAIRFLKENAAAGGGDAADELGAVLSDFDALDLDDDQDDEDEEGGF